MVKSPEEVEAGKVAQARYYRVYEALAAAHGETTAEAAPRRGQAFREAKVALAAVAESNPDTAEDDLCDTLSWLGRTLKDNEKHFLTVASASRRVAEWRKRGGRSTEAAPIKGRPEPVLSPAILAAYARQEAILLNDPEYIARQAIVVTW